MSVLCMTGWQQPANALADIAPDGAEHFDYAAYDNAEAMFRALPRAPRLAIGWSLGGQLLVRAVAGGYTQPERLLLLAAPFQWIADAKFTQGFPAAGVDEIRNHYRSDPGAMLKNLNALIAMGDVRAKPIARALNGSLSVWSKGMVWLEELVNASCAPLDLSAFPPVLIIHGLQDSVIRFANAQALIARMPQAQLLLWPQCAHAPHLHDANVLRDIVSDYV